MSVAAVPKDESRRLAGLRDLGLLDTPYEERFDRITRLAGALFDVPIATISLIDANRQWFKSCIGMDDRQTERSTSFCAHAILEPRTLVVEDATQDPRFADNPNVTGPGHIRFYAGHPLMSADGALVGTLCIVDVEPRTFGDEDVARLLDLAAMAQAELTRVDESDLLDRLQLNERRLWTIIDSVAEGIVSFEEDGEIRFGNLAAERIFGAPPAGLSGAHVDELVAGMSLSEVGELLGFGGGEGSVLGQRALVTGVRRDGSEFPLEIVVQDARVDDRRVLVAVGQDVSEREEAKAASHRSEQRFRAIFDHAEIGITFGELDGDDTLRILEVNPAFTTMVGYSADALRGSDLAELEHPDERLEDDPGFAAWRDRRDTTPFRRTVRTCRRDGSVFWGDLTLSLLRDDTADATYLLGLFSDVTKRREAEQLKDEFISVVGHELRTPLTSIRGSLGLIQGGVLGELPAEASEMLGVALTNADRLVRLVNDILDIERIDAGHLELVPERIAAADIVAQSLPVVQAMADEAGVTLATAGDTDLLVRADPDRIVQTLVNLLGNAIKFSPEGGVVTVTVEPDGDGAACISVADQGRGVPPEQLGRIFERFRQVDASDAREKGGTGLGLAIAQRIVDRHGGTIWAESEVGEGCTMRFTLPRADTDVTLLLCGPDAADLDAAATFVEALGCTVLRAHDVETAVAAIEGGRPTTVVLPLTDPGDGWGAALADAATAADVPVVAMSGIVGGEEREAHWELLSALRAVVPELAADTVLIVEDDPSLATLLSTLVGQGGASTRTVHTAADAIAAVRQAPPAAIVLDLVLPDGDGFAVVDQLRGEGLLADVPILVYTALDLRAGDRERLQLGRTEFLTKLTATPQDIERRLAELLGREEGPA